MGISVPTECTRTAKQQRHSVFPAVFVNHVYSGVAGHIKRQTFSLDKSGVICL